MPAPAIPHVSHELARSARDFFQPLYLVPQTDDDGLEEATNVLGGFGVLREWQIKRDAQRLLAVSTPARVPPTRVPKPPTPAVVPTRRPRSTSVKSLKE